MAFLDSFTFLSRVSEIHTVGGKEVEVFRASTYFLRDFRVVAKPFFRAWSVLFSNTDKDSSVEQTNTKTGDNFTQMVKSTGVGVDTIKLRLEQRAAAIDLLVEGLLGEGSSKLLCSIICDALKRPAMTAAESDEFLKALSIDVLQELLTAIWRVNEKTLAPLLERAGMSSTALKEAVQSKLRAVPPADTTETSPTS